jgi:hypothetical protein
MVVVASLYRTTYSSVLAAVESDAVAAWRVVAVILVATWLWKLIRYRWISIRSADAGCWFVHLKWLSSFLAGASLIALNHYWLATMAGLWPLVTLGLMPVLDGGMVGTIQKKFLPSISACANSRAHRRAPKVRFKRSRSE